MDPESQLRECIRVWRRAFTSQTTPFEFEGPPRPGFVSPDLWDRGSVVTDLEQANLLEFTSLQGTSWSRRQRALVKKVAKEIAGYRAYGEQTARLDQWFTNLKRYLRTTEQRLSAESKRSKIPDVGALLHRTSDLIKRARHEVSRMERVFWKSGPPVDWLSVLAIQRVGGRRHPNIIWEIDGRFQVRLAGFLGEFLSAEQRVRLKRSKGPADNKPVDLKTISKLILLVYLVAGLAVDEGGGVFLRLGAETPRQLTAKNIDQNLKRAGIDWVLH